MPKSVWRWGPEALLALLAATTFLGYLGATDLWGKREQRAAAEALDTIDHDRWLVAQIQGRPRLEKPPLPRWTTALLLRASQQREEWVVRLPSALSALGMIALVYAFGCRLGGRSIGLTAGLALISIPYFVSELRQAGNDGPLAFFTTLALYAAWRRLHGAVEQPMDSDTSRQPAQTPGARAWVRLMYLTLGLGVLTKGPVILILVALTVIPYLALARSLGPGLRVLADGWGLALFSVLALSWPVPVWLLEPEALGVWWLEMAQKAGSTGVKHHQTRPALMLDWFWVVGPWTPLALAALAMPWLSRGRALRPWLWFPWLWAFANLAMFCLWNVAKPNYYLPCLPAVALLVALQWQHICQAARLGAVGPRRVLQGYWVVLFTASCVAPVIVAKLGPAYQREALIIAGAMAVGVVVAAWAWRRGAVAGTMAPITAAFAVAALVVYGAIGPALLDWQSHRVLAAQLERIVPHEERTILFFHEIDEGLWFYLREHALAPIPGSHPQFNQGYDLLKEARRQPTFVFDQEARIQAELDVLRTWIAQPERAGQYVLIRGKLYDLFAPALHDVATPLYREAGLDRNELVLLRVADPSEIASTASPRPSRR